MPEQATTTPAVQPKPAVSIATGVNAVIANTVTLPKGLTKGNTKELTSPWFHGILYSETSARKTSTAAQFDTPENTRIIVTRRPEQLIPLRKLGYEFALCENAAAFKYALQFPEKIWPDWAKRSERTLIVDDATEGSALLLEEAKETTSHGQKAYGMVKDDFRDMLKITLRKPMHLILVALAKVKENGITNADTVFPDLPPSVMNLIGSELEYCFYIKVNNWKLLTDRDRFVFQDINPETQKTQSYTREIFAKNKLELPTVGMPGVLAKEEVLNLRAVWEKVKKATEVAK